MIAVNHKAFWPTVDAIKQKYYQMFRGKGGEGIDEDESGAGGASGSRDGDGARRMEGNDALDNLRAHPQWQ